MKTAELTGAALDWAVAKCEGLDFEIVNGRVFIPDEDGIDEPYLYCPSNSANDGERIIDQEDIGLKRDEQGLWIASYEAPDGFALDVTGETLLIAAMRCYVTSRLGEHVEVPAEFLVTWGA